MATGYRRAELLRLIRRTARQHKARVHDWRIVLSGNHLSLQVVLRHPRSPRPDQTVHVAL